MVHDLQKALKGMVSPGDRVICAVSGGKDSMALLWGLYLLREKLGFSLEAAHFDHGLRAESGADAAFVKAFCRDYGIPVHIGSGTVTAGKKGLEAAARDARYGFFENLPGLIATAHTADDNAETVLMHLVRGTGLKGLGGIAPRNGRYIRPMLNITRAQVEAFLQEYSIPHVEDATNETDAFLRNRLRHHVMPLLKQENPRLAENVSAMAQRLRLDEEALAQLGRFETLPAVAELKNMHPAVRSRVLEQFLKNSGVKEPEARHLALAEQLLDADSPSARAEFPGGVTLARCYDRLVLCTAQEALEPVLLSEEGTVILKKAGLSVTVQKAQTLENTPRVWTLQPQGRMILRSRQEGDSICLPSGSKSLKKLFIDRKIPASQRGSVPVLADEMGILGVYGVGADQNRMAKSLPAIQIVFNPSEIDRED